MHYPKQLAKHGCGPERLREIFTTKTEPGACADSATDAEREEYAKKAKKFKCDSAIRRKFERRIRNHIFDGIGQNCRSSRQIQAVDMAWDSPSIAKQTVPLMLWAMGKIKIDRLYDTLCTDTNPETAARYFKKVPTGEGANFKMEADVPRICDISVDLMRSYITRRHAALDAGWSNYWPLYEFHPRGVDPVTQCRADALTQRIDMMSDGYGYRHHDSQCRRDMLLYGNSTIFPRGSWDVKSGWRPKVSNVAGSETDTEDDDTESYVVREGVDFVNPNPGRIFYDSSSPLAKINTDTGPRWIGYWDIMRSGDLWDWEADYFNTNEIFASSTWAGMLNSYPEFFGYYYTDPCVLKGPTCANEIDPTICNDRNVQIGTYSADQRDMGVLVTQYFERINPLKEGIGAYNCDVWLRLVVAGDCTVIGAEFLPSLPAAHGAINWNDSRMANQSMGMALLGYQDQASNIMSHMIMQLRASLVQLWLIDKDSLEEPIRKEIEANAGNANWWVDPKVLVYSATKLKEQGINDPRSAFTIIQNQVTNVVQQGLAALNQLLNLADRLLILSPNELGQPIQRESSAREVQEIASSVQSIYSFINQGPREILAAKKEILYESLVCCGTDNFRVPITMKYTLKTIKAAGFELETDNPDMEDSQIVPINTPITGSLRNLVYDYVFDSRDGSERVSNVQGAQVVMQLLQSLLQIPGLAQKMGLKAIYDMTNLVIRMSGAPLNFQFQTTDGQDEAGPEAPPAPSATAPPQPQAQPPGPAAPVNDPRTARLEAMMGVVMKTLGIQGAPGAAPDGAPPSPTSNLTQAPAEMAA